MTCKRWSAFLYDLGTAFLGICPRYIKTVNNSLLIIYLLKDIRVLSIFMNYT
jgi:hypothetical protein